MGDRELLEAAAKAAGLLEGAHDWEHGILRLRLPTGAVFWNPLTDDGDALRLAVKLRMTVTVFPISGDVWAGFSRIDGDEPANVIEQQGDDPAAATRRAIVRAAAALSSHQGRGEPS